MKSFLTALQFLTILPVKIRSGIEKEDFGRSLLYFPLVGLIIGAALASIVFISAALPQMVMAALILIVSAVITGGIHIDGFADTCDGLATFTTKEKALEAMRDSRIGAMGATGLALLFILKFSLLSSLGREDVWKYLILMVVFARWAQVLTCSISGYVREEGKAKYFMQYVTAKTTLVGAIFTLALFVALAGLKGVLLFLTPLVFVLFSIKFIQGKLGGMTGDTIGAINEISETAVLLAGLVVSEMIIW